MKTHVAILFLLAAATVARGNFGLYPYAPSITLQPSSVTVYEGQSASFYVEANGYPYPTFQWRRNGVNVGWADTSTSTYSVANASTSTAGNYDVVVVNSKGRVTSRVAVLTVLPAVATITSHPVSVAVTAGNTTTLRVIATGPNLKYQWKKDGEVLPGETFASITLGPRVATDGGSFSVVVTALRNAVESEPAVVTVRPPPTRLTSATTSYHATIGTSPVLRVTATGWDLTYQWKRDGAAIPGATSSTFTVTNVTAADMGFYSVVVSGADGVVESPTAILTVAVAGSSRLANASTRAFVLAGDTLSPGFVLRGVGTKQVLLRAVGPSLAALGVAAPLSDPRLELMPAGASQAVASNEDWGGGAALAATGARVGAFALPGASKDAALQTTLSVNGVAAFSARIGCANAAAAGTALAEVYDADAASSPVRIINLSTLAFVGSGANELTCGFVIDGSAPKHLLIRAVGPGLEALGVGGVLADPQLTIVPLGRDFVAASNDNWGNWTVGDELKNAFAAAQAFALAAGSKDAALVTRLPPGGYTVTVSGVGNTDGTALVEIYDLDP